MSVARMLFPESAAAGSGLAAMLFAEISALGSARLLGALPLASPLAAAAAATEIFSGCNCKSIQLSTPIASTCWTSPGRGPKASRFSACTARFCSVALASGDFSFFLASDCGTAQATLTASRIHATVRRRDGMQGGLSYSELLQYEPANHKRLLTGLILAGLGRR